MIPHIESMLIPTFVLIVIVRAALLWYTVQYCLATLVKLTPQGARFRRVLYKSDV